MPTPYDPDSDLSRRLELLEAYDILNTPPEQEFDDVVLVASEACETPVALVSLVEDQRQWFKARIGFEACDTPIEQSVCRHSLASAELLVIPDLAADPRTKDNALVTLPPNIRFYAGAPLIGPDDIAIGTLCVIDTVPRPEGLTESQKRILSALARQVIAHLEARRVSHRKDELFRRQKGLSASIRAGAHKNLAAQEAGRVGTFEIDIATGEMEVSAELCRIFDVPVAPRYPASVFESKVVEEDRDLRSTEETRADGSAALEVQYRIRTEQDGMKWISRHATIQRDENGVVTRMLGTVQDVTEQIRAGLRMQALLDLGDRLRDLDDVKDMALAAADLLGRALYASRAGFGIVDRKRQAVEILPEWRAPGIASVAGPHYLRDYGPILDDMTSGRTVVISDVAVDPRMADRAARLMGLGARVITLTPILDHGSFNLMVFVHHGKLHEWTDEELAFVRSVGDRVQIAMARLQAKNDQVTLNREIGHRLKNTFAMIQAIANQTLRPIAEREHVASFEKRLHALSRAHDILLVDQSGATFKSIVDALADTMGMEGRLDVEGPEILLGPRGAMSLGLLLHELGTNAMKYGAWSLPEGMVKVRWSVSRSIPDEVLQFTWAEFGGPAPKQPERRGFGSKLIQMGLIGTGGVALSYDPPGFSAEMSAALQQLQQAN